MHAVKRCLACCLLWPLLAAPALAADCRPPTEISEAIAAGHEYVVKVKVLRVRPPLAGTGVLPVMFSVARKYRGAPPQILDVDFDPAEDPRALNFHPGDVFLISTMPSGDGARRRSIGNACTLRQLVRLRR
jgi:hypothetical protein